MSAALTIATCRKGIISMLKLQAPDMNCSWGLISSQIQAVTRNAPHMVNRPAVGITGERAVTEAATTETT